MMPSKGSVLRLTLVTCVVAIFWIAGRWKPLASTDPIRALVFRADDIVATNTLTLSTATPNALPKTGVAGLFGASSLTEIGTDLITVADHVGIGWATPTAAQVWLDVRVNSGQGDPIDLAKYSTTVGGNKVNCVRGRGTVAAPLSDTAGDYGCQLQSWQYDTNNASGGLGQVAEINFINNNTISAGVVPQDITFWSNDTAGNERESARFDSSGHWIAPFNIQVAGGNRVPVLSGCGAGASIVGSDTSGTITVGTGATGCVLTLATSFGATTPVSSVPHCTFTSESGVLFTVTQSVTAATVVEIGPLSSTLLDYTCLGT